MVTQVEIARHVGLDVSSVNKILNRRPGPVFRKKTIGRVFKVARQLGFNFGRLKFRHRRRNERRNLALETGVSIYRNDGSLHSQGRGVIRDFSLRGARVTDIDLPGTGLPVEPFFVALRPVKELGDGSEYRGKIVRLSFGETVGFGIEFCE